MYVVDALAVIGAFTGEILVDIGYRPRVGVDSHHKEKSRLKGEALVLGREGLTRGWMMVYEPARILPSASKRGWFSGWARVSIILRAVPEGSCVSLSRVMTKRTSARRSGRPRRPAAGAFRPCSVDQPVELLELSAFALPADIFLLGFAPGPLPVKEEKALAA